MVAATSGKGLGSTTVGCGGQTILTTAGSVSGSTSSTFRWSWLIWAEARGVMGMIGQGWLLSGLGPGERYQHPSGPPDSVGDISPHSARKPAAKHAQMHSAKSSLLRDYLD